MSGFVVLWNLDGQPADRRLVEGLTGTLAHRGPDGEGYWFDRAVGFGHRMLHATPESLHATQPLTDESGTLCLAWDGRIDNRDDLRAALSAAGMRLRSAGDAELALRAYQHWGRDCPRRLLGDFAFVLYDSRRQELLAARDPIGCKPLYYYADDRLLLIASDLLPLLAHPAYRRRCNQGMLGEYLACQITSQEDTLYEGIARLPPSHLLLARPGRLAKRRYWDADPARAIAYRSDRDYTEHFGDLLAEAVRCRLRGHGQVGAQLSGGLDSSSVAAVAQHLCDTGRADGRRIETFSLVFPGLACDESAFIDDMTERWGFPSHRVVPDIQDRTYFARVARQDQDFPGYPNGTMANPLRALARDRGIRVLLTGSGGDEWLTGSLHHAADLLRSGRLLAMLRRVGPDAGNTSPTEVLRAAVDYGLRPLLPRTLRRTLKRLLKADGVPDWIDPHFARRIDLADRLAAAAAPPPFPSLAQSEISETLTSGWWAHSVEVEERAAARYGIEERHPFCDRRLIEFALALPENQRWRGAETKFILRRSMRGLLPESVRGRTSKAEFSPVLLRAFEAAGGGQCLFDAAATEVLGMVRSGVLQRMCREMSREPAHLWPLWTVSGIEIWLRAVWNEPQRLARRPAGHGELASSAWQ